MRKNKENRVVKVDRLPTSISVRTKRGKVEVLIEKVDDDRVMISKIYYTRK